GQAAGTAPAPAGEGAGPWGETSWSQVEGAASAGGGTSRNRATARAHPGPPSRGSAGSSRRRAASNGSVRGVTAWTRARQSAQASTWRATASRGAPDRLPAAKAARVSRAGQVVKPIARLLGEQVAKLFPEPFGHARPGDVDGADTHPQFGGHV